MNIIAILHITSSIFSIIDAEFSVDRSLFECLLMALQTNNCALVLLQI